MKPPKFTKKELEAFAETFFANWAHLKEISDSLARIADILEAKL